MGDKEINENELQATSDRNLNLAPKQKSSGDSNLHSGAGLKDIDLVPNEETKSQAPSSSGDVELPTPPDGGWGWVVVFASFMIHIIADGVVYSFGIFYVEFLDYFKSGSGATSWVGSLVPGITLASGPIASILTNKYGCRVVTILGAVLAAAGFIISLFAKSIVFLYFSFGIVGGLGFGLIYLPAIVSVGFYFEKKRAFATGLAVCGSGVGTFIFAPLSTWMLREYNWQGAILVQAGLILNCVVCGALFRPLKAPKRNATPVQGTDYEKATTKKKKVPTATLR